jgi:hypothetical protein
MENCPELPQFSTQLIVGMMQLAYKWSAQLQFHLFSVPLD